MGPLPLGVERSEHEVHHSPLSSVQVKNEWSCASTSPMFLNGVASLNDKSWLFQRLTARSFGVTFVVILVCYLLGKIQIGVFSILCKKFGLVSAKCNLCIIFLKMF